MMEHDYFEVEAAYERYINVLHCSNSQDEIDAARSEYFDMLEEYENQES